MKLICKCEKALYLYIIINTKTETMITLIKDSQSRITRYGMKCTQIIDGHKCYAFAHATKKGNTLIISDNYSDLINDNNESVSGVYKIISVGIGRIADVVCEKL